MMRKVLLFGFLFSVLFGFVVNVDAYVYGEGWELDICMDNFTESQKTQISKIYDLFYKYADVIEQKYPWTSLFVENYLINISQTLNCDGGFGSYTEFKLATISLLRDVSSGEVATPEEESFVSDKEAEKAILSLQWHLVDMMGMGFDYNRPFNDKMDLNLELEASDLEEKLDLNLRLSSDGVYDLKNWEFDANFDVDFDSDYVKSKFDSYEDVSGLPVYKLVDTQVNGWINLDVLKKNNIYVKLNDLDVNIGSDMMSEDELWFMEMMKWVYMWILDNFKWQYINVSDGLYDEIGVMPSNFWFINSMDGLEKFKEKPIMKFMQTDDNEREWVFVDSLGDDISNFIPNIYSQMLMGGDYFEDINDNLLYEAGGNAYLIMKKNGNDYTIWLSKKLTKTADYEEILTWNDAKLKKIAFPLWEDGSILYEKNQLKINYEDNEGSLIIDGDLANSVKTFDVSFVLDEDPQVVVDGVIRFELKNLVYSLFVDFTVMEGGVEVGKFSLEGSEAIKYLNSLNIEEPVYAKTLDDIKNSFDSLGEIGF